MLDAAHGDTVRASEPPKRAHALRPEVERAGVEIAGRKRRRKPPMPARTDSIQDSRLTGAVARSRRKEQSLKGMRRRVRNNGFCTNVVASCGSLSRAGRSLGRRRPASVLRRLRPKLFTTHFLAKRSPGPAAGVALSARAGPGRKVKDLETLIIHCSQTPRQTGICNWRQRRLRSGN